jgi:D-proline reductase (dithiol) PrdB
MAALQGEAEGAPIEYMARTKRYYGAQDFAPYAWAHHEDIPWHTLTKPLAECRVAIVTTAVPAGEIPKPTRTALSWDLADAPKHFRTDELSWDKKTTHTDDRGSYFPLATLTALAAAGVIGGLAPRFHFVPTEYSQRNTRENDAPAIVSACQADEVDIAILIPL